MYKNILRIICSITILTCSVGSGYAQYSKSIKVVFKSNFATPFNTGGQWQNVDIDAVKSTIISRMTEDFSFVNIPVSQTSGNMIVEIGGTDALLGIAVHGIGSFVLSSDVVARVYSGNFATESTWQGSNATVARIAEAIAGVASHEVGHILNNYHAYMFNSFDPANTSDLNGNHHPKEADDLSPSAKNDPIKHLHLMATGTAYISHEIRAIANRFWGHSADQVMKFGVRGGENISHNIVWGTTNRTWDMGKNVTVNSGRTFLMGAPSYSHDLNGYDIKAVGAGRIVYFGGLTGSFWKLTNTANTELYGLYSTQLSAHNNKLPGQVIRDANDNIDELVPDPPANLSVAAVGGSPKLTWNASIGANSYTIERRNEHETLFEEIASGVTVTNYTDEWIDTQNQVDRYYYRVMAINSYGPSVPSSLASILGDSPNKAASNPLPKHFGLSDNYPNPFNPATVIKYQLPEASRVTLKVYSVAGQLVATLVNEQKPAGFHSVNFDGSRLASGTYIYRITAGNFSDVKRMVLIK